MVAADATGDRGYITLIAFGSPDLSEAVIGEDGVTLGSGPLDQPSGRYRALVLPRVTRWDCDRRRRVFEGFGSDGAYRVESSRFVVRTPSCANRLVLHAPRRVAPGSTFRVKVTDTWGLGGTGRVCFRGTCGGPEFHADARGRARVVLTTPYQRVVAPVAVGVKPRPAAASGPTILLTGDSMMQTIDSLLADRLGARARVVSDVRVGTGLSSPILDWRRYARRQVRRHHPHATVMFLGTVEGYRMGSIDCCGEAWVAEYARRARQLMRIYAQRGAGRVIWVTVPTARDPDRHPISRAVNAGLRRAARGVDSVSLVDADNLVDRDARQGDGIHLSLAAARSVARRLMVRLIDLF